MEYGRPTVRFVNDEDLILQVNAKSFARRFLQEQVVWKRHKLPSFISLLCMYVNAGASIPVPGVWQRENQSMDMYLRVGLPPQVLRCPWATPTIHFKLTSTPNGLSTRTSYQDLVAEVKHRRILADRWQMWTSFLFI